MTDESRIKIIRNRLKQALIPHHLEVIDESKHHVGHAEYEGGGRHFAIIIAAKSLNGVSRVEAHRQIYALFNDMIPDQIHALRIKVVS